MGMMIVTGLDSFDDLREFSLSLRDAEIAKLNAKKALESAKSSELSPLATDLKKVWEEVDFGCQTVHISNFLHHIVKAVTKEDIDFTKKAKIEKKEQITKGNIIRYHGSGVLLCLGNVFLRSDGYKLEPTTMLSTYNPEPELKAKEWHLATLDEINEFYRDISSKSSSSDQLTDIISYFGGV